MKFSELTESAGGYDPAKIMSHAHINPYDIRKGISFSKAIEVYTDDQETIWVSDLSMDVEMRNVPWVVTRLNLFYTPIQTRVSETRDKFTTGLFLEELIGQLCEMGFSSDAAEQIRLAPSHLQEVGKAVYNAKEVAAEARQAFIDVVLGTDELKISALKSKGCNYLFVPGVKWPEPVLDAAKPKIIADLISIIKEQGLKSEDAEHLVQFLRHKVSWPEVAVLIKKIRLDWHRA